MTPPAAGWPLARGALPDADDLPTGEEKAQAVRVMFDTIAPRYDLVNRIMTFRMDVRWRRRTVRDLDLPAGSQVLDLACGTGDLCVELVRGGHQPVGFDLSFGMLVAARTPAPLIHADVLRLPVPDAAADGVTCGFALRNLTELPRFFAELARVLRPGGTLAVTVPRWYPEALCWALSDAYAAAPGGHVRIYRASVLVRRLRAAGLVATGHHHAHALHAPYWWLRCAVGVAKSDHPWVAAYHRLLVREMTSPGSRTARVGRRLDPVLGKSLVVYLAKPC